MTNFPETYQIRLATEDDIASVRKLVNEAYQELAVQGLNYTASYQDEEVTRQRMEQGRCFLLLSGEEIIGTILLFEQDRLNLGRKCAYVGQFGIHPQFKRMGLGSRLMDFVEQLALEDGYEVIQLDTAKPATHLVNWYQSRQFEIVASRQWEGKTYESWILEKRLEV